MLQLNYTSTAKTQEEKRVIKNVEIKKINMKLKQEIIPIIETFEILHNTGQIEEFNERAFYDYIGEFANNYSDELTCYVIENRKYDKQTIGLMKNLLDKYRVYNTLKRYL